MGSLKIILLSAACIIPHLVFSVNQKTQRPVSPTCAVSGVPGVPGVPGLNGRDGSKGDGGPVGPPGKKGPKGSSGTKGDQGPVGTQGKTGDKGPQGEKGEKGPTGLIPQRNWKQCAWKALNERKDKGLIKEDKTALKVEFDGDFRVAYCVMCCKRWYFTFNGVECSKPVPIDAVDIIHTNHGRTDTNVHKHSHIGGYCEGIGKGTVRVGFMVGDCPGYKTGSNAHAGAVSTNRIVIEEVPPPQ